MVKVEDYREQVIGLRPVYTDIGNSTEVFLVSGEVLLDKRGLKSVIKSLVKAYAIDLKSQRQDLELRLKRKGPLPFYLNQERIFIPLKMRRAVTDNDRVNGYIDVRHLKIEGRKDGSCTALISTGQVIEVFNNIDSAIKSKEIGKFLLEEMQIAVDIDEKQAVAATLFLINTLKAIVDRLDCIEEHLG